MTGKRNWQSSALAAALALGLGACGNPHSPAQRAGTGALIGAGAGAGIGALAGGAEGAAIGAVAGGLTGAAVGAATTPSRREYRERRRYRGW